MVDVIEDARARFQRRGSMMYRPPVTMGSTRTCAMNRKQRSVYSVLRRLGVNRFVVFTQDESPARRALMHLQLGSLVYMQGACTCFVDPTLGSNCT
jgi:hypothetical protein